ncbi:MAG: hypothetical protein QW568_01030 [Candidatus Anstonellaceae archaeon]
MEMKKILTKKAVKEHGLEHVVPKFWFFKIVSKKTFEDYKTLAETITKFDKNFNLGLVHPDKKTAVLALLGRNEEAIQSALDYASTHRE